MFVMYHTAQGSPLTASVSADLVMLLLSLRCICITSGVMLIHILRASQLSRRRFVVVQASLVQYIGMRYLVFSSIIGSVVAAAVLVPELMSGWSS